MKNKVMIKICTDIKQSKRLIELGIDMNTADMCYHFIEISKTPLCLRWEKVHDDEKDNAIPAWSLAALLDLMPKIHGERPKLDTGRIQTEKYYVEYPYHESTKDDWYSTKLCDSAVDAAFEMVCWLKENGKI